MKIAALALLLIAAAPDATLPAAKKALETARAELRQAMEKAAKDPPSLADLDAALAAVAALKSVLDANTAIEPKDLEYAKAALAARKEVRVQREYLEDRRGKVHVHDRWRALERVVAKMDQAMQRMEANQAGAKDFDEARAAAGELEKALEEAQPLTSLDAPFAKYVEETRASLAKKRQAIEDRWTLLNVDKLRMKLADARPKLDNAVAALVGNAVTDVQLELAQKNAAELSALLEQGRALENLDAKYRDYAEELRRDVKAARARIDEVWIQTGLSRMQAEVEPVRAQLNEAAGALRGKHPSTEQLDEARTAAIVVAKLLEKYQPAIAKSPVIAKYAAEVKRALEAVQLDLERRAVDSARAELTHALANLGRRGADAEQQAAVDAAEKAANAAEKASEASKVKDAQLAKLARDLKAEVKPARAAIAKRKLELAVRNGRAQLEGLLASAKVSVGTAKNPEAGELAIARAGEDVKAVKSGLEANLALENEDRSYAAWAAHAREGLARLEQELALVQRTQAFQKATLGHLTDGRAAADGARATKDLRAKKDGYEKSLAELRACVTNGEQLLGESPELSGARLEVKGAKKTPKDIVALCGEYAAAVEPELKAVLGLLGFEEGPKRASEKGRALVAQAANDAEKRAQLEKDALAQFEECMSSGKILQFKNPELKDKKFEVAGAQVTLAQVIAACTAEAKRIRGK